MCSAELIQLYMESYIYRSMYTRFTLHYLSCIMQFCVYYTSTYCSQLLMYRMTNGDQNGHQYNVSNHQVFLYAARRTSYSACEIRQSLQSLFIFSGILLLISAQCHKFMYIPMHAHIYTVKMAVHGFAISTCGGMYGVNESFNLHLPCTQLLFALHNPPLVD